jgi:transcriptional regulator with XRE-family HTH domain
MPEPKYSTQEFAQIIKQKYPQYANVEDNALVSKILEKYPQYSSSVDLGLKKKDEQQLDTSMVTEESMVSESQLDGKKEPTLSYVGSRQVAVSPDVAPTEEAFVGARPAPKPMTAEDRRATLEAARESQANNFMNIARNTLGAVAEGAVGLNTYLNRGVELLLLGNQTNYFSSGSAAIGESIQRDKEKLQAEYIGEETVGKPITQTFIEDPVKGAKLVAFEASRLIPQMYALGAAGRSTFPSTTVAGKALETGTLLSPRTKLATEIMSEAGPIIPLGLSAAGTSYAETVKENPEDDIIDAITNYAVASYKGAGEIASELLFKTSVDDLIRGGFRKNLISDIAKAEKPTLQALKGTAKRTGTEAFQEGLEELAVEISNNAIDGLVFGEDMLSSNNIYGMADAFILGAGIGGPVTLLSQGPSSIGVANDVNKRKKIAEEVNDLYDQHQNGNLNAADKSIVRGQIINKLAELKKVENNLSDFYSEFSEEDQQEVLKANQIISMGQLLYEDSNSDVAKEAIADFVAQAYSDKTKVEAKYSPNIKVYEYDSEEEAGVPSPIQEREAPIATELEQGPSAEAPEAGGVLQVPAEERPKVVRPEEAKSVTEISDQIVRYKKPSGEEISGTLLIDEGGKVSIETDTEIFEVGNVTDLEGTTPTAIGISRGEIELQDDGSYVAETKRTPYTRQSKYQRYTNAKENKLDAIVRDEQGNVQSVVLTDDNGVERTFTGPSADYIAYNTILSEATPQQLQQADEAARQILEQPTEVAPEAAGKAIEPAIPAPAGARIFNEPLQDAKTIASGYAEGLGLPYEKPAPVTSVNEERAKRIAQAFDEMVADPNNPKVKAAYEAMAKETLDQFQAILNQGYTVEINNTEPYANSQEMIDDLRENKRMKIFSTEFGFGDEAITPQQRKENPLLRDSGFKDANGQTLLVNDVFRFVHDFFGHAKLGNGFGAIGEENAWRVHSRMYTPLARLAMTTETRGQNSWVNFSGINEEAFRLRDEARKLREEGRTEEALELLNEVYEKMRFAEQKIGLLPQEFSMTDEEIQAQAAKPRVDRVDLQKSIDKAQRALKKLLPNVDVPFILHNTREEFNAAMDAVSRNGATKDAIEYGRFIPSRNEIHINLQDADIEAPLHEAFHAVLLLSFPNMTQARREKIAKDLEAGLKKVLKSGTAADIDLMKEMDRFVKEGGYTAEEAPEEFSAQLAGFMGANYMKLSKPTQNKLIEWINSFIGKFFPSLKIKTPNEFVDFMNSFAAAANEQVETSEESRPLTPSPIEISPELFPEKSSKGAFDTEGTYLANEPKVNIKDLFTAFKAENNRNPNVWIWMSDQLKRGQYVNPETGVTLDLEGGIGFAFDPKNREQNVVWSSGLSQKTLQDRIGKSDFIWFMSGSPLTSFNFSKGTTKAIIAEIEAGLEKFKGKSLEGVRIKDASFEEFVKIADKFLSEEKYKNVKKWEGINSALTKYKSGIIDHPSRMKVAENLLHEGAGKKMQIPIQQFLHQTLGVPTKDVFHSLLRDEALIKNNIANGDLTLLVKPTGIIDNAGLHDTYPHAITGDVIGMPEQIYNVLDVVPEDAKKVISKETGLPLEKPSAPAQIKTAVGDVGRIYESEELSTNSVYGTMIKESSSKQFIEGQQQSQIDNEVDNTVAESKEWKEKERNSFERFSDLARLKIQDKFRDIIRMQENIELATDKPVGLDQDFRNAETLMYGKAAKDLQDSEEKVKNISDLIKQSGLSIEEFNDLLYALHAQERNRYIRLISTNIGESLTNLRKANNLKVADVAEAVGIEVEDYKDIESTGKLTDIELKNILDLYGKSEADFFYENALVKDGSGMTDQEAQSILAENGVKNLVNPSVKDLPSKVGKAVSAVHNLIQDTRDVMLRDGLETPETISVFDTVYKNYVPLQGFADEEGLGDYNVEVLEGGRKLEVRGRIKEAKGRTTKADSPLVQAVMQNTNTIIRGRKNEVMQKLYNLAKENPNKDVWEVIDPEVNKEYKKAKKDGKISLVAKTISDYMLDPSMVAVRVNGEYKFIRFTDSRMAETLRGATVASTDFIVKFLGRFNRLLSSFITTYDPEFVLRNFSRDIQTAVLNAYSEQELNDGLIKGEKIVASIIKSVPKSIKAIFAIEGGKDVTTEYDKYYKEFVEDGGKTAWFYSKGSEELSNDIQSLLDGKKDSALKLAGNFVERVNTSVENGVRLSAYIESRKAGISREKAAEFAKNLTVNFNKSGEWGTLANSLYLFFNASVQGTSRLIRTLKPQFKTNDDGTRSLQVTNAQKIVIGIAVLGAIMSMINEALSDDDEDGKSFYSKIPDFEKERNIIIMKPNGKGYFKIPLPYGVNVFYVLGGSMADASQGVQGKGEAITNVLQASIGSFSPINFPNSDDPARWITKLLTPTIGQIPVGLALNEDYFGRTIYNDNFPFDKSPKPASELGREGGDWAKWLNKATGGSEFRSGFIDINPDKTDFILETLSGGAGRFALRSTKSIGSLISGNWDELEPREIPFARVFYGQPSKYINQYDYYEKQVLVNQLAEEAKAGIISGKEKSSVLKMAAINKAVASNLRKYKKLEDAASNIKDPEKKEARLNQLERLRYAEIARFQKIYEKLNIDDIK